MNEPADPLLPRAWFLLTKAASEGRSPSYGELGRALGIVALAVGQRVLDPIRAFCEGQNRPLPPLTCIVVNKKTRLPGAGCGLSLDKVRAGWQEVFGFDWDSVPNPFSSQPCASQAPVGDGPTASSAEPPAAIDVPSADQLQMAVKAFDEEWGGVGEVLYSACADYSDRSPRSLMTTWILIDRAYSAGLDRLIGAPEGEHAVDTLFRFATEERVEAVAKLIGALVSLDEPLDEDALFRVVVQHGKLCALLSQPELTDGKCPRSFVSKLLHFHCRVVPIMDSDCDTNLRKRVPNPVPLPSGRPADADPAYFLFCQRFYRFYVACRTVRPGTTVKDLDAFLWTPPGFAGWNR